MSELTSKTLILTGASRGIGRALALELAQAGAQLILNARHPSPLDKVAVECEAFGVQVRYVVGNAAEAEIVSEMVNTALELGDFHGFVHNAGVLHAGPLLWELPQAHFREVLEANVTAGYQLIRFAVPELIKQSEGIAVFFGSGAADSNLPGIGTYAVAKAAEEHLARQLATEAPEITSFVYRPGVVETRMQQEAREAQGGAAEVLHRVFRGYKEQGVLLSPEDAAKALVRILTHNPRRFHGKIATWRDGV